MTTTNTPIDDGGPAFPGQYDHGQGQIESWTGLSLRDWFAGQALAGMTGAAIEKDYNFDDVAADAFAFADAMIAARKAVQS